MVPLQISSSIPVQEETNPELGIVVATDHLKGKIMKQTDQGITRTGRGEEQPADKDRAQNAQRTAPGEASPSREETRTETRERPSRSGRD